MKLAGFDVGLEHPIFLIAGTCARWRWTPPAR